MIFCFFCVSIIFLQPLFENGFWTQYNRYFGTPKHLASEFHKSNDALNVKYTIKKGTEIIKGEGICISAKESEVVLLEKNGFHILNKDKYAILEVKPEHTDQQLLFKTFHFYEISIDSLNTLMNKSPIQNLEIYANKDFEYLHNNVFAKSKNASMNYPNNIFFKEIIQIDSINKIIFSPNPKIQTYRSQIEFLNNSITQENFFYNQKELEFNQLKKLFHQEKNTTQKESIYQRIKILEKEIQQQSLIQNQLGKIEDLKMKIRELQQSDYIKFQEQKMKYKNDISQNQIHPTLLSGNITYIIIEDHSN